MFYRIAKSMNFLTVAIFAESSARQVAMGFALGVAIGVLPKTNIMALGFLMMLFSLRINMGAGLVSALIFSLFGPLADPFFHLVGEFILSRPVFGQFLVRLYAFPMVPWTELNNTVVVGATVVGLLQLYPTYRILRPYLEKRLVTWAAMARHLPLGRVLLGS